MEKHMFQVKEINKAPFEDAERVFETSHPELRYAVASQRAVGFYESLKDYNENASLWGKGNFFQKNFPSPNL